MSKNTKQSSSSVGSLAAHTLKSGSSSQTARSLAGSVLAQSGTVKQTGAAMETTASRVLVSPKYAANTKTLAGSVLAQSNRKR